MHKIVSSKFLHESHLYANFFSSKTAASVPLSEAAYIVRKNPLRSITFWDDLIIQYILSVLEIMCINTLPFTDTMERNGK